MTVYAFSAVVFCGSLIAGFLGSLTGLGGGIVMIPPLVVLVLLLYSLIGIHSSETDLCFGSLSKFT